MTAREAALLTVPREPTLTEILGDATATVYLAGPTIGYPLLNLPAFASVAYRLRGLGFGVLSPHEGALAVAPEVDAVVTLPGWQGAPAAVLDVLLAEALGLPVVDVDDAH